MLKSLQYIWAVMIIHALLQGTWSQQGRFALSTPSVLVLLLLLLLLLLLFPSTIIFKSVRTFHHWNPYDWNPYDFPVIWSTVLDSNIIIFPWNRCQMVEFPGQIEPEGNHTVEAMDISLPRCPCHFCRSHLVDLVNFCGCLRYEWEIMILDMIAALQAFSDNIMFNAIGSVSRMSFLAFPPLFPYHPPTRPQWMTRGGQIRSISGRGLSG